MTRAYTNARLRHKEQKIIKNMSVMYKIWTDKKKNQFNII